jgi:hypothetical protein
MKLFPSFEMDFSASSVLTNLFSLQPSLVKSVNSLTTFEKLFINLNRSWQFQEKIKYPSTLQGYFNLE